MEAGGCGRGMEGGNQFGRAGINGHRQVSQCRRDASDLAEQPATVVRTAGIAVLAVRRGGGIAVVDHQPGYVVRHDPCARRLRARPGGDERDQDDDKGTQKTGHARKLGPEQVLVDAGDVAGRRMVAGDRGGHRNSAAPNAQPPSRHRSSHVGDGPVEDGLEAPVTTNLLADFSDRRYGSAHH